MDILTVRPHACLNAIFYREVFCDQVLVSCRDIYIFEQLHSHIRFDSLVDSAWKILKRVNRHIALSSSNLYAIDLNAELMINCIQLDMAILERRIAKSTVQRHILFSVQRTIQLLDYSSSYFRDLTCGIHLI